MSSLQNSNPLLAILWAGFTCGTLDISAALVYRHVLFLHPHASPNQRALHRRVPQFLRGYGEAGLGEGIKVYASRRRKDSRCPACLSDTRRNPPVPNTGCAPLPGAIEVRTPV